MTDNQRVQAAQYLRMSTEHQQYSLENQSAAIQRYADLHGFEVTKTYSDSGRTGLVLRNRAGLQELLRDVVGGSAQYKAVLVYDVSRWGRFQDTDESAHYEFLCRSAGVPVHYCAETFANDGTLPSLIMKSLKRTMAGEFSRELGVKVFAGQRRLAGLGFKMGGLPGYGFRRMMLSASGLPKQQLAFGERKSLTTDRVTLVPGPPHELAIVREIYRMLLEDGLKENRIARELNRRGIGFLEGSSWDHSKVHKVLTHPKYIGWCVYGQTARRLHTPSQRLGKTEWVIKRGAHQPLIDESTFLAAQQVLMERRRVQTDEEILEMLRQLLTSEGRLSLRRIQECQDTASPNEYRRRFGSLQAAYNLIGYNRPELFGTCDLRRRIQIMRHDLMARIVELSAGRVEIVSKGTRWRSRLRIGSGRVVAVLPARTVCRWKTTMGWCVDAHPRERKLITLIARLNPRNDAFADFRIFRSIKRNKFYTYLGHPWLRQGTRLCDLARFCEVVAKVADSGAG